VSECRNETDINAVRDEPMKTAFLFPGQGAQFVGMGREVAEQFGAAKEIFDKAGEAAGFDIAKVCFDGPAERLNTTTMSQPAIFTVSAAIFEVIRAESAASGLKANVTAGLSLGEYTALYAAGAITFEDGLRLVKQRGEAMQAAADASDGGMVAIIGLNEAKTKALCDEAGEGEPLAAVNFNCPGQVAISGSRPACARAEKLAAKYGAIKAIRLEVAGAFHTDMMKPAAEALAKTLAETRIAEPTEPKIIRNIDAQYYTNAESIRDGLSRQLTSPIFWQKCMERLLAEGLERFYEIGPGRVLTALMRRISRKTKVINLGNAQAIKELLNS